MSEQIPFLFTLPNGLRVVFQPVRNEVAHVGITVLAGSRFEQEHEEGLAHFLEHSIFKGTSRRKAYHVLSRLDSVGGELNAYTAKEEICLYASFSKRYLTRTLDILADIVFNSVFPEKEIQKEKEVIVDEINSYLDTPSDMIFDEFEQLIFPNHALGRNILGTQETVHSFTRQHLVDYVGRYFAPSNMVLSIVGQFSEKRIKDLVNHYFASYTSHGAAPVIDAFTNYNPVQVEKNKSNYQSHGLIGGLAYPYNAKERKGMVLLNNILGGPALNSRLSLSVREKYGYSYSIESNYTPYADTGFFSIYFGTDKRNVQNTLRIIHKELKKLREEKLGTVQLSRAKEQLKGHLALAGESNSGLMLALGKSVLIFDQVDTTKEIFKGIDALTAEDLRDIANQVFDEQVLSYLIYNQREDQEEMYI
jgi:predicted Zn-dependent peptidase